MKFVYTAYLVLAFGYVLAILIGLGEIGYAQ